MPVDDNWPDDPFDSFDERSGEPAPKRGMSTASKVLIILLCVGGVCCLLCCGGIFYLVRNAEWDVKPNDPQAAIQTAGEIVRIDVPDEFKPTGSMKFGMLGMKMKMAIYQAAGGHGSLILTQIQVPDQGQQVREADFRRGMQQQGLNNRQLKVNRAESREFEIRGEKVKFLFAETEDVDSGTPFRQVSGVFPGKEGTVFLLLQIEEEAYDEEATIKMIESIK